jgi:hypothetical protein
MINSTGILPEYVLPKIYSKELLHSIKNYKYKFDRKDQIILNSLRYALS